MYTRRMAFGALATGLLGLGAYAFGVEPLYRLVIKRYDLALPRWPKGARPLKIAIVADLHAIDPWMGRERIAEIVDQTNALGADIVLLLGDYMGAMRLRRRLLNPAEWAAELGRLKAPLGRFAILGNHDYWWAGGPEPVKEGLEAVGIPVLVNRAVRIDADGHRFWITGTTSILTGPYDNYSPKRGPGIRGGLDNLAGTLASVYDDAPIIHLAHEPDMFPHIPDRVALTLSGHTHGGQVWLPLLGRPMVTSRYGQTYAYGHVVERDRHLVVSGGLGCSHLPVRFGVPPEIGLIEVRSAV